MFARSSRVLVASVASVVALFSFVAPAESIAFAQEPLPAPAAPATAHVTPAPGQAAASAPSSAAVPITATCSLGDHPGVEDAEARTAADVVCHELAKEGATNTAHEVRFGKLGGKTLVTVASRNGNTYDERRTLLTGMDELPTAAPRLAGSLSDGRTMEQTKTVDNVLESEARRPKVQQGQMGFEMGLFGMTSAGEGSGASGGIDLGLDYRASSVGVTARGRAGGIGSTDTKVSTADLDLGVRYYFSNGETSPFVGGGVALSYFNLESKGGAGKDGSGMGAFGELGYEMLRTQHVAVNAALRVDAPFYALGNGDSKSYVAPLSLNVGMLFH